MIAEPPADVEAEQSVLGAILLNNAAYQSVSGFLLPEHFSSAVHGRIFATIGELIQHSAPADPIMIKHAIGDDPALVPHGGTRRYLAALIQSAVTVINAPHYARMIIETARRRAVFEAAQALAEAACSPNVPLDEILPRALAGLPQAAAPGLPLTCAADLAEIPAPERPWRVRNWVPDGQVTLFTGKGGGGKSHIALQLQVSASTGLPWLGLPVEPCRSIGFYAEDDEAELHRRLHGIIKLTGATASALRNMHWRSVVSDHAELVEIDHRGAIRPTAYFRQIERTALDFGARLLILDAVTNLFGADEINRRQVNAFIGLLRQLAIKIDGAIVLLGHPSAAGISTGSGLSGSTHWHNASRSRLYLDNTTSEDADPDERTLTRMKANYAGAGDVLRLRWQDGAFVALDEPSGVDRAALASKADRVFRTLLTSTYAEGSWVSANPSARNYAPASFAKHPDREGLSKPAFDAAMHRLLRASTIKIETYGPKSQGRRRLALA